MQLLLVINLDKAQVKSTCTLKPQVLTRQNIQKLRLRRLTIPIYFVEIFLAEEPKKKNRFFPSNEF